MPTLIEIIATGQRVRAYISGDGFATPIVNGFADPREGLFSDQYRVLTDSDLLGA